MNSQWLWRLFTSALPFSLWILSLSGVRSAELPPASNQDAGSVLCFATRGVVQEVRPAEQTLVIRHETITNYMPAMTMPFRVRTSAEMAGLKRGDEIAFQLFVTETNSWVQHIVKTGKVALPEIKTPATPPREMNATARSHHPLLDYKFTNELGQAVSLNDFRGTALAITFFYTRCPIPEYCPRLSKNFQAATQKLIARPDAPTNWHFLSISFDSTFDTPEMLKVYGASYQADPAHWSFLTGPAEQIGELARQSGLTYESTNGIFNHDFRTLIVDAAGHLQTVFPTGGDLSDAIVEEILKAASVTNASAAGIPR
jgi:protein SCO1/2